MSERNREFQEFLNCEEIQPPKKLSETILLAINEDLKPSFVRAFGKAAIIHVMFGAISLLFCPQFGVAPFQGHGLMALYDSFGPHGCMARGDCERPAAATRAVTL